jgi:hypothetical protein
VESRVPLCEYPLTSAPQNPNSLTQRVNSWAAAFGSWSGNAANPLKRFGFLAICSAK